MQSQAPWKETEFQEEKRKKKIIASDLNIKTTASSWLHLLFIFNLITST